MLQANKQSRGGVGSLLHDPRIRQVIHENRTMYTAVDLVAVLSDSQFPAELWEDLKSRQPAVAGRVGFVTADGLETLDLEGVLRLIQALDTPRAQRLKNWIAAAARERIEEADDPELALLRTRR